MAVDTVCKAALCLTLLTSWHVIWNWEQDLQQSDSRGVRLLMVTVGQAIEPPVIVNDAA